MDKEKVENRETSSNTLQIFCRIRPADGKDKSNLLRSSDTMVSVRRGTSLQEEEFEFEHVFGPETEQLELFDRIGRPLVEALLCDGKDALLFSYGVTGSGKSHTIGGEGNSPGLIPQTIDCIFAHLEQENVLNQVVKIVPDNRNYYYIEKLNDLELETMTPAAKLVDQFHKKARLEGLASMWRRRPKPSFKMLPQPISGQHYTLFVSFVEIYNNYIYDLLAPTMKNGIELKRPTKVIRQDIHNGDAFVSDVNEVPVKSADEAIKVFLLGLQHRQTGSTLLNEKSSRSHSLFTIKVVSFDFENNELDALDGSFVAENKRLKVNLFTIVDLAGLERAKRAQNTGTKLTESGNINSSLFALRNCFDIIRKSQSLSRALPIPYRQHKLTRLFQRFFERHSLIRMIICVKQNASDFQENCQALSFAKRAHEIIIEDELDNSDYHNSGHTSQFNFSLARFQHDTSFDNADSQELAADVERFLEIGEAGNQELFEAAKHACLQLGDHLDNGLQANLLVKPKEYDQDLSTMASNLLTTDPEDHLDIVNELGLELGRAEAYHVGELLKLLEIVKEMLKMAPKKVLDTPNVFQRLYQTPRTCKANAPLKQAPISKNNGSRIQTFNKDKRPQASQQIARTLPTKVRSTKNGQVNYQATPTRKQLLGQLSCQKTNKAKPVKGNWPLINSNYRSVKSKINSFRGKFANKTSSIFATLDKRSTKIRAPSVAITPIVPKVFKIKAARSSMATWSQKFRPTILMPVVQPTRTTIRGPLMFIDRLRMLEEEKERHKHVVQDKI